LVGICFALPTFLFRRELYLPLRGDIDTKT